MQKTISIITATYNRAHTLGRTIDSVLAQDYAEWELIIVDDGSTDKTSDVLGPYTDPRIRFFKHPQNKGVAAAKNTGLDNIRGEWFTLLDSDDELVTPDALSALIRVPATVDAAIDAITCNCIDAVTGQFLGKGLEHDQYLDAETIVRECRGDYWGLTKTSLLQGDRFNEKLRGFEDTLWNKINKRAHRYYIHKGLLMVHTEGDDRVCVTHTSPDQRDRVYRSWLALLEEREYLSDLRRYSLHSYGDTVFAAGLTFVEQRDKENALLAFRKLLSSPSLLPKAGVILLGVVFGDGFVSLLKGIGRRVRASDQPQM